MVGETQSGPPAPPARTAHEPAPRRWEDGGGSAKEEDPGREEAYEVLGATQAKRALLEKRSRENEKISVLRGWNASCAMPGGGNETRWAPTAGSEAFGFGNAG